MDWKEWRVATVRLEEGRNTEFSGLVHIRNHFDIKQSQGPRVSEANRMAPGRGSDEKTAELVRGARDRPSK